MEVRGQEKEMGMPRRRDQSVVSDAVLPQSLDHHHHHHPVYHHQVNPHINKAGRNPEPDPDPVPAPAATPVANRSSLKSPQPAPTPPQPSPAPPATTSATLVRYRECMKNHAAATGGHVLDGCGEFMPRGEEGTPQALKCAACDCHRSFHRKEINGESHYTPNSYYTYIPNKNSTSRESIPPLPLHRLSHGFSISAPSTVPIAPVMMAFGAGNGGGPAESSSEDLIVYQPNAAGQSSVQPPSSKKRFRTKFNQEQKDKMMEFAEKLEWKIQKQDDEEVQQFCAQVGVKRQVFKVWMHNNKQATKKKQM